MSLHAVTASITLLTAIPGSGKTLRMVQMMQAHLEQGDMVFACNVAGLRLPGVMPFDDPREWKQLPAGAVLFVDEAQGYFRARSAGKAPEYITDMETIRHSGIRLVLATQQPGYLDTHLRGLVGRHEHLVRKGGAPKAIIYRSDSVIDNVREVAGKKGFDKAEWDFPVDLYNAYDSAQVHTVKRQIPARLKFAIALFGLAALGIVGVGIALTVYASSDPEPPKMATEAEGAPMGATLLPSLSGKRERVQTPEEYAQQLVPRVPSMPWSAPVFDGRAVRSEPTVACIYMGEGEDANGDPLRASCSCYTEQATRYNVHVSECKDMAFHGSPYNPHKAPQREAGRNAQRGDDDRVGPQARSGTSVTMQSPERQASYGQFRDEEPGIAPTSHGI